MSKRIIIAMCGASGVQYGVDVLRTLKEMQVDTHLVLSTWAKHLIQLEAGMRVEDVEALAIAHHDNDALDAPIASTSFSTDGMVVIPSTVKTVAEIAGGHTGTLIGRAADNMLRMRKPLVICVRETPLSGPCLENLAKLALFGAVVMPLCPGFYHRPTRIEELFDFITCKVLDAMGIDNQQCPRWEGSA